MFSKHLWLLITSGASLTTAHLPFPDAYTSDDAPNGSPSIQDLTSKAIHAIGGQHALSNLQGITYNNGLYRTSSLMQSYAPDFPDLAVATSGTQNLSYDLSGSVGKVVQRIDRVFSITDYWIFARPFLEPYHASIVTHTGPDGYSCYVKGNENIFYPEKATVGYTDDAYTALLAREALRLSPKLLLAAQADESLKTKTIHHRGHEYPSIISPELGFAILLDPESYLPYIVRAYEHHAIFGPSTSDLLLLDYIRVGGVKVPRRYKLSYNEKESLIDVLFSDVTANPTFAPGFFDGLPDNKINTTVTGLPPTPAGNSSEYGTAEVYEYSSNTLWGGKYPGKLSNVTVTKPIPSIPGLHHLVFNDFPGYTTNIAVMKDAIMVADAPPHQSKLVIKWIRDTFGRSPTHLLVTHHHHDHNYGAADYVAAGAKLVVPEEFKSYWESIPNAKFETASRSNPFIYKSSSMQVRGIWPGNQNVHAMDWMYFVISEACPTNNSTLALVEADAWNPGFGGDLFNQRLATQMLNLFERDRMPHNYLVVPVHGSPSNITDLYEATGYDYPNYQVEEFLPGGPWCSS